MSQNIEGGAKLKKRLSALVIVLLIFVSSNVFANMQDISLNNEYFQETLLDVIEGKKAPEVLTDRIIVKEYDENGKFHFESISKQDYNKRTKGISIYEYQRTEYVQPDFIRYASYEYGERTSLSWGKDRIGAQNLIDKLGDSKNQVIVAVLDTGVDYKHVFLRDRVINGYNIVEKNNDPMDINSHGTHVAGIIVDSTNDNVKIMPVKILNDEGLGYDSQIAEGIYYAVDNGADIINMSLGGPGYSPYMANAIKYAVSKDVLVVVAAGNERSNTEDFYPASEELAVVVSATDEDDNFASFSNYGRTVDIAAPGVNINSSIPNNGYEFYNGTSMATPYISGIAALIKQEDINRSNDMIEEILKIHTDDLGIPGRDDYFGEGIVNVNNYSTKNEEFILISPKNDTRHHKNITVKYFTSNNAGAKVVIKINGETVSENTIFEDGYKTEFISLEDREKGPVTLSISLENNGAVKYHESVDIIIEQFNTSFKTFDYKNDKQNNFVVKIYGIKDNAVRNFEHGVDSELIYWLDSMNGEIKVDIDYDELFSTYDSLVVVASDNSGDTMPVYIRELTGAGDYVFRPDNLQKIVFKNETEIEGYGIYSSSIYPSYKGILLPCSGAGTYTLGEDAVLYMDEGNHFVEFGGFDFTLADRVNGTGETVFVLSEDNSTKVKFIGDSSLSGVDGFFEGNSVLAWILAREENLIDLRASILNPGENNHRIYHGNYTLNFIKEVPDKGTVRLYKDFTADENVDELIFKYGDYLESGFKLYYNDSQVKGIVDIRDYFDNVVILSNSFYGIHSFAFDSMGSSQNIIAKPSSLDYQNYVILENMKTGRQYSALIDGDNNFAFSESIPDGKYELYTDFNTEIFPYEDKKFEVEIRNNSFVDSFDNNSPEIIKNIENISIKRYDSLELDLYEIFFDPDGDELIFTSNKGYIHNGKYYYSANELGKFQIEITATDGKSTPQFIQFVIDVIGGDIIYEPEDPDIILLDKKYNIPLDKEWTIEFNRKFKTEEIMEIKLMKGYDEIPVTIDYLYDETKVIMKPKKLYENNADYYIIVKLKNGKKYKMEFKTWDKGDGSPCPTR